MFPNEKLQREASLAERLQKGEKNNTENHDISSSSSSDATTSINGDAVGSHLSSLHSPPLVTPIERLQ